MKRIFICACFLLVSFFALQPSVRAETAEELRQKIEVSKSALVTIEKEIQKYQTQLNVVGSEKKTLQNAIAQLELSRKKLQATIQATQEKIHATDLVLEELAGNIISTSDAIAQNKKAIAEAFRSIDQTEGKSTVEILLGNESMQEVWRTLEEQMLVQTSLAENTRSLSVSKNVYQEAQNKTAEQRKTLDSLKTELSGQSDSLVQTKKQKDSLLADTKNKEANYQALLAEKKKAYEDFQREINQYESKLSFVLNPSSIPSVGSGVLAWPLDPTFMTNCLSRASTFGNEHCITQYFGNTEFARTAAYSGQGHNGIDFGSPTGTGVVSALGGTVVATNEEVAQSCQYGKWVLVRHGNGLTTLYGHLSAIVVRAGQAVETGQTLGYSGATGYATGPHLHFTVYASEAVQFKQFACKSGKTVNIPVAAFSAYLNPMQYL